VDEETDQGADCSVRVSLCFRPASQTVLSFAIVSGTPPGTKALMT
jgi:hypothetical protein